MCRQGCAARAKLLGIFLCALCASAVKQPLSSLPHHFKPPGEPLRTDRTVAAALSPERRRVAEDLLSRLSSYKPEAVIFFGSFARNESDELSDIDLVIIKDTQEDFFSRIRSVMRILDLKMAIDVLVYTPEEFQSMQSQGNGLIETLMEEGIRFDG
jgi:predicted nucleotidyltransferase